MKYKWLLYAATALVPLIGSAQRLDPTLLDQESTDGKTGRQPRLFISEDTRFSAELSFALNAYSWYPVDYEAGDAIIRQTLERSQPDLSAQQLNNTMFDMQYNYVLSTFKNSSGNNERNLGPRLFRLRYKPIAELPIDVSVGFGRSVALFYANTQVHANGVNTAVNQTDLIATAFTDQYFHLREIYENSFIDLPRVPLTWKPLFAEIGMGYEASKLLKFIAAFAFVPAGKSGAQSWYSGMRESNVNSSLTELENILTSKQLTFGCQIRLGATSLGFEQRWFSFLGDTSGYTDLGASNPVMPNYFSFSFGYHW